MEYIAHREEDRVQLLLQHMLGPAERARDFAEKFGKGEWGYCCGCLLYTSVVCAKSIQDGFVHQTIGTKEADAECDLNYCIGAPVETDVKLAMSNSLGFGGHNAVLLFQKYE